MAQRTLAGLWKFMGEKIKKILLHFSTDRYSEAYIRSQTRSGSRSSLLN